MLQLLPTQFSEEPLLYYHFDSLLKYTLHQTVEHVDLLLIYELIQYLLHCITSILRFLVLKITIKFLSSSDHKTCLSLNRGNQIKALSQEISF